MHELKNPCAVTLSYLELMDEQAETLSEEQGRWIKSALIAQRRLASVVESFTGRSWDAGGAAAIAGQTRFVCMSRLLARQVEEIRVLASREGVEIDVDGDTAIEVVGNVVRLSQLLSNLIENAVRHSGKGGRVSVLVSRHEGNARVEVRDEGPGFPADPNEMFEPFRAHGPSGQFGIGLAVAELVAREHGGSVSVVRPGEPGARVRFELPLSPRDCRRTRTAESGSQSP